MSENLHYSWMVLVAVLGGAMIVMGGLVSSCQIGEHYKTERVRTMYQAGATSQAAKENADPVGMH